MDLTRAERPLWMLPWRSCAACDDFGRDMPQVAEVVATLKTIAQDRNVVPTPRADDAEQQRAVHVARYRLGYGQESCHGGPVAPTRWGYGQGTWGQVSYAGGWP